MRDEGIAICWGKLGTAGQKHFINKTNCKHGSPTMEANLRVEGKLREGYTYTKENI